MRWPCHKKSTPAQRGKCSACGVWLCQWQEHNVHRLELLEQTKQKNKLFQDIKGTNVKGPSSTTKVRPTPPSKTSYKKTRSSKITDSMEDN